MLIGKQKDLANEFVAEYADLGVSWVDFVDGELEVHFKESISNPWTARMFVPGSKMKILLTTLENKMKFANKPSLRGDDQ